MPLPISDQTLSKNIESTLDDIASLFDASDSVNTRAKTVYYKAIVLMAASVLEAMVYHFIDCNCKADPELLSKAGKKKLKRLVRLNKTTIGTSKEIWLAEDVLMPLSMSSIVINSKDMNEFCFKNKLINKRLFNRLEYARKKRNQIHLQTLDNTHRSYTAVMVNNIGLAIDDMYVLLEQINPVSGQVQLSLNGDPN